MSTRKRTLRRTDDRATEKLARDLEKLALLAPGGAADRAILVTSPSEVEVQARSMPCPVCGGEQRVEDHLAETVAGLRVRVAKVACALCGRRRAIYFRLRGAAVN